MTLRKLKREVHDLTFGFKGHSKTKKIYSPSYRFHRRRRRERFTYYTGLTFRTSMRKRGMAGKALYEFARNKLTGRAVHRKKRKNKGKAKKKKLAS
jgi:hypothetical protein